MAIQTTDVRPHERAREVIGEEADALRSVAARLGADFDRAVEVILACRGRVVLTGMGKHGLIARKIAATLASTGTLSLYLNPAEGRHGDLGMVSPDDVVVALSNSGGTDEVLGCLPFLKHNGNVVVALTGNPSSELARQSDIVLNAEIDKEACPLNLAPMTSTTVALAIGDALAVVLMEQRGFGRDDFARRHPAGALGRALMRVADVVRGKTNPVVADTASFGEALAAITAGGRGAVAVADGDGKLVGILTDGDVRRALDAASRDQSATVGELWSKSVSAVMTHRPMAISPDTLAVQAVDQMENGPRKVLVLPVVDEEGRPVAMVQLHDLVSAGV